MLTPIEGLPDGVLGVRAGGTVTGDDYRLVLRPLLAEARRRGDAVHLLFHLGPELEGFTKEAAWQDLRLGLEYLHDMERCAVVTDHGWVGAAAKLAGAMVPCEVRAYPESEKSAAIRWLTEAAEKSTFSFRLLPESDVLLVELTSETSAEDFARVRDVADEWLEADGEVRAMVIHADDLSAWKHPATVLRHWQLIWHHHRQLSRVAVAVGGSAGDLISAVGDEFTNAEVKEFAPDQRSQAICWAAGTSGEPRIDGAGAVR